jgi:hypothetical protein
MTARLRLIGTAAVILVVFTLLKTRSSTQLRQEGFLDPEAGEWVKVGKMEEMYGLCSREGDNVWTVGGGGEGRERKQCLVVKGKEVVETGSLGQSSLGNQPWQ